MLFRSETISLFDDFSADDMQYGDMVEQDFLTLGLSDISAKVDPYRDRKSTRLNSSHPQQSGGGG
ncbi:DUF3289 family protein, partial [Escherichia coli]